MTPEDAARIEALVAEVSALKVAPMQLRYRLLEDLAATQELDSQEWRLGMRHAIALLGEVFDLPLGERG